MDVDSPLEALSAAESGSATTVEGLPNKTPALTARGALSYHSFINFLPKLAILGVLPILGPASFNSPGPSFLRLEA